MSFSITICSLVKRSHLNGPPCIVSNTFLQISWKARPSGSNKFRMMALTTYLQVIPIDENRIYENEAGTKINMTS